MEMRTMTVFSVGDVAAHLTKSSGQYVSPSRVVAMIDRLVRHGELPSRRVGQQRIVLDSELAVLESEFGIANGLRASDGDSRA